MVNSAPQRLRRKSPQNQLKMSELLAVLLKMSNILSILISYPRIIAEEDQKAFYSEGGGDFLALLIDFRWRMPANS